MDKAYLAAGTKLTSDKMKRKDVKTKDDYKKAWQ